MSDVEDLQAYRRERDAESFRRLVLRYQGMVYSTCCRTLDSLSEAEDAVQETFLKLAKSAGSVRSNLGAWLHSCALSTAKDRRDSARARQQREEEWSQMQYPESVEDWRELVPVVDDCIADLPEDDRELLVQHYLAGRTQTDLATERGISRQATTKRLQRIVGTLRQGLRGKGVTVSVAALGAFLTDSTAAAAVPASLTASLCKIGLAGVSAPGGAATVGVTGTAVLGGKSAAVVAAGVLVVLSGAMAHRHRAQPHTEDVAAAAAPVAQPAPPQEAPVAAVQPAPPWEAPAAAEPAPPQDASPRTGDVVAAAAPATQPAPPPEAAVAPAVDRPATSPAELYTPAALLEHIVESEEQIRDWRVQAVLYAPEEEPEEGAEGPVKVYDFEWGYSFGREFRSGVDCRLVRRGRPRRYPVRKTMAFDGDKVRLLAENMRTDPDGTRRSLGTFGGSVKDITLHSFRGRATPKVLLGYELGSGFETLGRALRGAESVTVREEWGVVDGHQCVVLEVVRMRPSADGKINDGLVWIDPERGYRALKYEKYVSVEPPRRWRYLLLRVDNVKLTLSDGIWFPTEGEVQFFRLRRRWPSSSEPDRPKPSKQELAELSFREQLALGYIEAESSPGKVGKRLLVIPAESLRLNQGVPDEAFRLTFPEGTYVADDRIQTSYVAGQMPEPGRDWAALAMEFVWVPTMACWVGKYEVSNGDIRHFLRDHDSGAFNDLDLDSDPQPAIATLRQAEAFAKWVNRFEQTVERIPDGYEYRLPTADEWTQLVRCGDDRVYPWGSSWPPEQGNYSDATSAVEARIQDYDDGFPVTCPITKSGCNAWGLFGVGGNVSEWTTDGDGEGVLRGGSWIDSSREELACDYRFPGDDPQLVRAVGGFRLILSRSPGSGPKAILPGHPADPPHHPRAAD